MARPLRIEYPGAFYHVTSRGSYVNSCLDIGGTFVSCKLKIPRIVKRPLKALPRPNVLLVQLSSERERGVLMTGQKKL